MRYHGNNICPGERTNERMWWMSILHRQTKNIMPLPTMLGGENIKITDWTSFFLDPLTPEGSDASSLCRLSDTST